MPKGILHLFFALMLLVALIFFRTTGLLSPVIDMARAGAIFVNRPGILVFREARNFFGFLGRLREIDRQNSVLTAQVTQLTSEVAKMQNVEYENRILRDALGFEKEADWPVVAAQVGGFDPFRAEQKAILNRGRDQGIAAGNAVILPGGAMVGVIAEVFDHTSAMDLITSSQTAVGARTSSGGATGVLRGLHGLGLLLDLISQSERVEPGESVVTSGLGGRFPANLLIGRVGEVRTASGQLFRQASVIPAASLHDLRFVLIIKK